jgi:tetratricopeptide (TPR) repeat protein
MQRTVATVLCLLSCWGWVATFGDIAPGFAAPPFPTAEAPAPAPQLFADIGSHHRPVSTQSPAAQSYFDQGLTWLFAFNHDEAIRSFKEAARLDPQLAIAWWGVAVSYGPHINLPLVSDENAKAAWAALSRAQQLTSHASPVERALIQAVAARYADPPPEDRAALDQAYAAAMQLVHDKYPDDPDIAVLYAESLMDLQPWDLWTNDGQPKGRTTEIVAVLKNVLAKHPKHPGATHLTVHAVEASPNPADALAAANALRDLVPISGHLQHMPSHIDARVGSWLAAVEANRKAISADEEYRRLSPRQDFYQVYMQHNHGFLSFACMMLGRSEEAIAAGREAVTKLPAEWVQEHAAVIDGYLTVHMDALKRFGKWDDILALSAPPDYLPFTTAMWRANRTIALAAKGLVDEADAERAKFREAVDQVPQESMAQQNPAHAVLQLAAYVVDGEIALARRDYSAAIAQLKTAVNLEDDLRYIEPPDWMVPTRHTLGAVYLLAGQPDEAVRVYQEDLARWPNNGWSLLGLAKAFEMQGKKEDAEAARMQFTTAWKHADFTPHASCQCAPMVKN